jgi:hypothetical protein
MKSLLQFIFPTVKAVCGVIGLIVTITISAYMGINEIAKAQGEVIEQKVMAVRNADFQHINGRFDRTDAKLDKILEMVKEK